MGDFLKNRQGKENDNDTNNDDGNPDNTSQDNMVTRRSEEQVGEDNDDTNTDGDNNDGPVSDSSDVGSGEPLPTTQDKEAKQIGEESPEGSQEDTRPFKESVERLLSQPRDERILTLTRLYLKIEKLEEENRRLSVAVKRLNRKLKKSNNPKR